MDYFLGCMSILWLKLINTLSLKFIFIFNRVFFQSVRLTSVTVHVTVICRRDEMNLVFKGRCNLTKYVFWGLTGYNNEVKTFSFQNIKINFGRFLLFLVLLACPFWSCSCRLICLHLTSSLTTTSASSALCMSRPSLPCPSDCFQTAQLYLCCTHF